MAGQGNETRVDKLDLALGLTHIPALILGLSHNTGATTKASKSSHLVIALGLGLALSLGVHKDPSSKLALALDLSPDRIAELPVALPLLVDVLQLQRGNKEAILATTETNESPNGNRPNRPKGDPGSPLPKKTRQN